MIDRIDDCQLRVVDIIDDYISFIPRNNSLAIVRTESGHLTDQTLGAAVGGVQAVFLLVLMGKLTGWLVRQGGDQLAFFNEAIIRKSVLFQYIYQIAFIQK